MENFSVALLSSKGVSWSPLFALLHHTMSFSLRSASFSQVCSPIYFSSFAPISSIVMCTFARSITSVILISCFISSNHTAMSRISSASSPFLISCCSFTSCTTSSTGGAISISDTSLQFTCRFCVFTGCTATGSGGALYLSSANYSVLASKFAQCVSSSSCQSFLLIATGNGSVTLSTVYQCSYSSNLGYSYSQCAEPANSVTTQMNSSHNTISNHAASIVFWCTVSQTTSYCQVESNSDPTGCMLNFQYSNTPDLVDHLNIVSNTVTGSEGLIWTDRGALTLKITNTVFYGNSASPLIANGVTSGGGAYPTLTNCVFDFAYSSISGCTTVSCSVTSSPSTLLFTLLSNTNCYLHTYSFSAPISYSYSLFSVLATSSIPLVFGEDN